MPELAEQMYCSQQICIPPTFPYLLRQYAKAAIRCQPSDLLKWSTAYFRCLSLNLPPPVKPRLEYPVPKSYFGMTPGWLKALMNQIMTNNTITFRVLWDRWQGACLQTENLVQILVLAGFTEPLSIPWRRFIAMCAAHLTDNLTKTMILICEILTEEPEGGSAIIPLEVFVDLYRFLAAIDASKAQQMRNIYFNDEALGLAKPVEPVMEGLLEEESIKSIRVEEEAAPEEAEAEEVEGEQVSVVISCPDLLPDETSQIKDDDVKYGILAINRSAGFMPTVGIIESDSEAQPNDHIFNPNPDPLHPTENILELLPESEGEDYDQEDWPLGGEDEDDGDVTTEQSALATERAQAAASSGTAIAETGTSAMPAAEATDKETTSSIAKDDRKSSVIEQEQGAVSALTQETAAIATTLVESQAFLVSETGGRGPAAGEPTPAADGTAAEAPVQVAATSAISVDKKSSSAVGTTDDITIDLSSTLPTVRSTEVVKSNATLTGNVDMTQTVEASDIRSSFEMTTTERTEKTVDGEEEEDYVRLAPEDEQTATERTGFGTEEEMCDEMSGEGTVRSFEEGSTDSAQESLKVFEPPKMPSVVLGNLIDVPAVPGIGPVVPLHMVEAVCQYMKATAANQHGMVMPRNIIHYSCPPLEVFVE